MLSLSLKLFETIFLSAVLTILRFYIAQQKLCSGYNLAHCVTQEFTSEKQLLVCTDYKCLKCTKNQP